MTFTLPEEIQDLLKRIGKETGLKLSTIVSQAVIKFEENRKCER